MNFMGTAVNMNGQTKVYPKDNYQTDIIANISLDWSEAPVFSWKIQDFVVNRVRCLPLPVAGKRRVFPR